MARTCVRGCGFAIDENRTGKRMIFLTAARSSARESVGWWPPLSMSTNLPGVETMPALEWKF